MTQPTPSSEARSVTHAAVRMGGVTAASRLMGFVRVLVIAAVLGTTYLGNTFQAANSVSNVLFELLAAGALSMVLVPTFVNLVDAGNDREVDRLASGLLGYAVAIMGTITVLGIVCSPLLARLLSSGAPNAAGGRRAAAPLHVPALVLHAAGDPLRVRRGRDRAAVREAPLRDHRGRADRQQRRDHRLHARVPRARRAGSHLRPDRAREDAARGRGNRWRARVRRDPRGRGPAARVLAAAPLAPARSRARAARAARRVGRAPALGRGDAARRVDRGRQRRGRGCGRVPGRVRVLPGALRRARAADPGHDPARDGDPHRQRRPRRLRPLDALGARPHRAAHRARSRSGWSRSRCR